ncbi:MULTISPECIES: hypothetical protein [unclassified Streptomyces]|uniref:hypothetical protein n=1 Tax=unclassified Streptomyces TaxID=2593676 RepID=UPI002E21DA39|nr:MULTISPECIES: hypothetical protein [unclassified Streptomyces]
MTTSVRQARRPAAVPQRRTAPRRAVPGWAIAVVGLLAALVITATALLTGGQQRTDTTPTALPPPPTAVVAEINGQKIPVRQFALYLTQERAATFAYFDKAYGVGDGPGFWTTPHGGTTPAAYLKQHALADAAQSTVVLALAHQHHLIADPGYDAFLAAWTAENARRRQAVAAHQVIYGPVQYTEANYFTYVLHDLDARLEQVLVKAGTIPTPESALRAYYRDHPDTFRRQENKSGNITTPPFGEVAAQVRQAYVHDRYQAMTNRLARTARTTVAHGIYDSVPVN